MARLVEMGPLGDLNFGKIEDGAAGVVLVLFCFLSCCWVFCFVCLGGCLPDVGLFCGGFGVIVFCFCWSFLICSPSQPFFEFFPPPASSFASSTSSLPHFLV